LPLRSEVFFWW